VLGLALVTLVGCSQKPKIIDADGTRVETQGNTVTVTSEDGEATINAGGGLSRPKDKMGDLPELRGNIIYVIDTPQGVSVTFDEISKSDYDAYVAQIKAQGFESVFDMAMGDTIMFMGQKDQFTVSVQLHLDGSGKGACVIVYGFEE